MSSILPHPTMRAITTRAITTVLLLGVVALSACAKPHLVHDISSVGEDGALNVVVEIPAGTNAKWEVMKDDGQLEWETRDGKPRVVQYLAYPANYGMIPRTLLAAEDGGDGDPLDVVVLGPAVPRGSIVAARPVAVLRLLDGGERDDKIVAVQAGTVFEDVTDLPELDARFPGVTTILETWFSSYKGPGEMVSEGFADAAEAWRIVEAARVGYR